MINKRYLFLIMLVCLFSISAVSAEEIGNETNGNPVNSGIPTDNGVAANNNEWYVNSSATGIGNGSLSNPFNNLNTALINPKLKDGDTIFIASGTYSGLKNRGLIILHSLNFEKFGDGEAVFDAEEMNRIFIVSAKSINITGLTFKNGKSIVSLGVGGAIHFQNSLINSNINATFINNKAYCGGAICFSSELNNVNISGNFTDNLALNGDGGAIYFNGEIKNSNINATFINNTAGNGGANYFSYNLTNVNITGEFINNCAVESGFYSGGGANYFNYGTIDVNLTGKYINNKANRSGGAIFILKDFHGNLTGSFFNNIVNDSGGAIYIWAGGVSGSLSGSYVGNNANNSGGAIYSGSGVSGSLSGSFVNNSAYVGGAIFINSGVSGNLSGSFVNNSAYVGGAIFIFSSVSGSLSGSFVNNSAYVGGAIYSGSGVSGSLSGSFAGNNASGDGGAIYISMYGVSGNLSGSFVNNSAARGGAIYSSMGVSGNLSGSFVNNSAARGGAVCIMSGGVPGNLTGMFINNSAKGTGNYDGGGAIYIQSADVYVSLSGIFIDNNATRSGGAIYVSYCSNLIVVHDSIFINNNKNTIFVSYGDNVTAINSWFGNNATNFNIKPKAGNVSMDNWLFMNATADPSTVPVFDSSDINFRLYSYNETSPQEILPYDNSCLKLVNLTISSTNGDVNESIINFGKSVKYSPTNSERGSVTASIENVTCTIELNNVKINPNLSIDSPVITYGENVTISLDYNPNATGKVNITLTGKKYNKYYANLDLNATITLSDIILPDEYGVVVEYSGDGFFTNATAYGSLTVKAKKNLTISASADPIVIGENATVVVTGLENATGNISVRAGDGIYIANITNGTASVVIPGLIVDTVAEVYYGGDYMYNNATTSIVIIVKSIVVSAPNLVKYYHGPEDFVVTVSDAKGPVVDKSLTITVNGVTYNRVTNANGTALLNINLNPGEFGVCVAVDDIVVNSTVIVNTTIYSSDVVKVFRNATQYYATFIDVNGTPIANTTVSFNVHGMIYNRTTDRNGTAKLNINLNPGEYIVSATNTVTGEMKSNRIKVIPVIESSDLTKYYKNASQFVVRVHTSDGGYVGAGEEVKFYINGVLYTRITNVTGYAKLNINLDPGNYSITSFYKDCSSSNNIEVLSVLNTTDLVMKYLDGSKFEAKVLDGQGKPYTGQTVSFNVNGIIYNRVTDYNAIARLNIRLMPGVYIITSSFNGLNVANKITISS